MRSQSSVPEVLAAGGTPRTAREGAGLLGRWETVAQALKPAGTLKCHLVLEPGGRFSAMHRSHGVYPGQLPGGLSSYARHEGRFTVAGSRIMFAPDRLVWWDRRYGVPRPTVESPSPDSTIYEDATFELTGDRLALHYTTPPAGMPAVARLSFARVPVITH